MVYNSKKKQQQPSGVALTDFQKGEIAALYEHTALNNKQIAVKLKVSEHCVGRLIAKFDAGEDVTFVRAGGHPPTVNTEANRAALTKFHKENPHNTFTFDQFLAAFTKSFNARRPNKVTFAVRTFRTMMAACGLVCKATMSKPEGMVHHAPARLKLARERSGGDQEQEFAARQGGGEQ